MRISDWSSDVCSSDLIWRGSLQAVPKAQWEAAECLGLTRIQRMVRVIAPQATRIALPPTVGFMVQVIKNTSIASLVVGYGELTYNEIGRASCRERVWQYV